MTAKTAKIFFLCGEEEWASLGYTFRENKFAAPNPWRSRPGPELRSIMARYSARDGRKINLIVANERMAKRAADFFAENYPKIPVLKFTFHPDAVKSNGWGWYGLQVRNFLEKYVNLAE